MCESRYVNVTVQNLRTISGLISASRQKAKTRRFVVSFVHHRLCITFILTLPEISFGSVDKNDHTTPLLGSKTERSTLGALRNESVRMLDNYYKLIWHLILSL